MKSQTKPHVITCATKSSLPVDLETIADRMHAQDAVARCALEIFQGHGSPLADWQPWDRAESEVLQELKKRAA